LQDCLTNSAELIDLNAGPLSYYHPSKGITLAWWLAHHGQWQLLQNCLARSAKPIDLNAAPFAYDHPCKDITLAYLLAEQDDQWQLLQACLANSAGPINLNASPFQNNRTDKGTTLAWLLAYSTEWELLQGCLARSAEPIDLNAAPLADNHPCKGMTLAYLLANYGQWKILRACLANSAGPIDLNATPLHESYPDRGETVAMILAHHEKFKLFEASLVDSADPIHLNAKYLNKDHLFYGETLACLLTGKEAWDILQACLANSAEPIDLNATPYYEKSDGDSDKEPFDNIDVFRTLLCELLVKAPQELLKNIFKKHYMQENFRDQLKTVSDNHPSQRRLNNLIKEIAIEDKYATRFKPILNNSALLLQIMPDEIASFVTELYAIQEQAVDYDKIQAIKGHLLSALAAQADLAASIVTIESVRNEIANLTTLHPVTAPEHQLKLLAIEILIKARENTLANQLMAEIFAKSEILEVQNDANESSSKRRKLDEEDTKISTHSNTLQNMPVTNFFPSNLVTETNPLEVTQRNPFHSPTYN